MLDGEAAQRPVSPSGGTLSAGAGAAQKPPPLDLASERRWLVVGAAGSGSRWHVDPFGTSAWNILTQGRKLWLLAPPGAPPAGLAPASGCAAARGGLHLSPPALHSVLALWLPWAESEGARRDASVTHSSGTGAEEGRRRGHTEDEDEQEEQVYCYPLFLLP